MKTPHRIISSAICLVAIVPLMAAAQDNTGIVEQKLTLALTKSKSTAALAEKDELGAATKNTAKVFSNYYADAKGVEINEGIATITKTKYSNVELLRDILKYMKGMGSNPNMKSIVGWSLVRLENSDQGVDGFYIKRKIWKTIQLIKVNEFMAYDSTDEPISAINAKYTYNPKTDKTSISDTSSSFGPATIQLNPPTEANQAVDSSSPIWLQGILNANETWDPATSIYKPSFTLTQIIGSYAQWTVLPGQIYADIDFSASDAESVVIDGTLTGTFSSVIAANVYEKGIENGHPTPVPPVLTPVYVNP